jgi:hypothetical protein
MKKSFYCSQANANNVAAGPRSSLEERVTAVEAAYARDRRQPDRDEFWSRFVINCHSISILAILVCMWIDSKREKENSRMLSELMEKERERAKKEQNRGWW